MHIDVACIAHEFLSLFSEGWPIFLEVCFKPHFCRNLVSGISNKNAHMILKDIQVRVSWRCCDLDGADIPWLCIKLTIHVRSGLHRNASLRQTQTWREEILLPFLCFP